MTPVRTRVIHGGDDEQASIERKGIRNDSLGTGVIHGAEDEKASIQKKESQTSKQSETKAKMYPVLIS
jgi:hypothetical protein